jgi:recombination protein RecA
MLNKTLLGIIATAQKSGAVCAYVDTHARADLDAMRAAGIEAKDLLASQPDDVRTGIEIAYKLVATGAVDLIVLDCMFARDLDKVLDIAATHNTIVVFARAE